MTTIAARCEGGRADGWTCAVTLRDGEVEVSSHRVRVQTADLDRLAPGAADPTGLVEASFAFLLEHEPRQAILRSFELGDIARYFPQYEREIGRRVGPG